MICDKCGRENEDRYKFCLGCGAPLNRMKAQPEPRLSDAGPLPVINSGIVSVVEPVTSIPVGVPVADEPEVKPTEPRLCTSCETPVPPDFIFCGRCGTRYEAPPEETPPEPEPEPEPAEVVTESDTQMTSPVRGRLVLINADGSEGESIGLMEGGNTLGRALNIPVITDDEYLSPEHVNVICKGDLVIVEDTGSLNGTFLRLGADPITLRHGDRVRVGQELLRYVAPDRRAMLLPGTDDTAVLGSPAVDTWGALHRVVAPDTETNVYVLHGKQQIIGRETGTILFRDDGFVSGQHARLTPASDNTAELQDLDSSNGTYIRLQGPYQLRDGDFLLMGQQLFYVNLVTE